VSKVTDLHEAPSWMRQDPLIIRAYRRQQDSFKGCFSSLWYVHNETVNIWSHLSVGICFVAMMVWASFPSLHGGRVFHPSDLHAFQAYLTGAAVCCIFSVRTALCMKRQVLQPSLNQASRHFTTASIAIRRMSLVGA
jgi:adiponectin receptor